MNIRVYRILDRTKMAGPGHRFCLWVQGCSHHCNGCMAVETWSSNGGSNMETDDIVKRMPSVSSIEGITFLGGEPMEQAEAVYEIAKAAQAGGLTVTVFTGYTYRELLDKSEACVKKLLEVTDLLIDGPFMQNKFDLMRPWVGSSNQQYIFLTDKYSESDLVGVRNQVEVRIFSDGKALINGMGDFKKIKKLI
jgi:anaerobic ribonucleoside-triphosphate reductase activating protein